MSQYQASCSCGQLNLKYEGEILKTSVCHCFSCQKRTGSAFGYQARLDLDKTTIKGQSTIYKQAGDSGAIISFHFCPQCGNTVYWTADWLKGASIIAALGAFNKPDLPSPIMQVYGNRKHHWVNMPESAIEYFG